MADIDNESPGEVSLSLDGVRHQNYSDLNHINWFNSNMCVKIRS